MSTDYVNVGRIRQKQRTQEALVEAARALVAEGETPTVEAAAAQAGISRTTAYRYFPSQAALLAAAHPETVTTSVLPEDAPDDAEGRLDLVVTTMTDLVRSTEAQQRTMLRLSLEPDRPGAEQLLLRQGRVVGWLEDALAPLEPRLGAAAVHTLAIAIRSAIGIEAYVWLTDVARLTPDEATALQRWNARALLEAATRGDLPPPIPEHRS